MSPIMTIGEAELKKATGRKVENWSKQEAIKNSHKGSARKLWRRNKPNWQEREGTLRLRYMLWGIGDNKTQVQHVREGQVITRTGREVSINVKQEVSDKASWGEERRKRN